MLKKFFFVFILLLLNNCATSGSALLGPILTGAKTGSIYQASFSYSTGKVFNEFISTEIRYFQNTKKSKAVYNYSALTTNVVMNYVIYKTGDDWEKLLHKVFVEDAKVKNRVYFGKSLEKHKYGNIKSGEYGRYSFYAKRYDYLRIAKLVLDHWNNDTCVGKYLKTMHENRVDRQYDEYSKFRGNHNAAQTYGGQFLFDPIGIEDRPILMMDGFAGQQVVIDFNNNRIITIHSTDRHYDYYSLVYLPLGADGTYTDKNSKPSNSSLLESLDPAKEITQDNRKECREYVNETGFVLKSC